MRNKKIIICIPTYKRPHYLKENLSSLLSQDFNYEFEIVVVDNDPCKSGETSIKELINNKIQINYYVEKKRGISAVRNKCIEICKIKKADYLVFIDDDEIANSDWLKNLFDIEKKYTAQIVMGPVLCKFESPPSESIKKVFFNRTRMKTGAKTKYGATGNVLINMNVLKTIERNPFDDFFNLIGGGDTDFFNKIIAKNIDIVWADNAITYEFISNKRSTLKNCLLRSFYRGTSAFYIFKINNGLLKTIIKMVINILIVILDIIRLLIFIIFINKTKTMKILKKILRGLGFVSAILNYKSKEYSIPFGN